MPTQKDFDSWEKLEAYVKEMTRTNDIATALDIGTFSHFLFRGQADSNWELETTLERVKPQSSKLLEYYRAIALAKTQIETFTNRRWDDFDHIKIGDLLGTYDSLRFSNLPAYDFLVYLRHHGFPSPLIDWSRSLYVAAYFAFREPKADRVALFVYQEHSGSGKVSSSNEPQIMVLGPNVRSHPRHFLQQGEYTMCCKYNAQAWEFANHASALNLYDTYQDLIWKFTVPATESMKVLAHLDEYNINAFSLFQSEEALMTTLARKFIQ